MNQYMRDVVQFSISILTRNIFKAFWIFPVKQNKVFCTSYAGNQYSCNTKYVTEYLLTNYKGRFQIIWAVNEPKKYDVEGVEFVKFLSLHHFYHFCTARTIIDNGGMPTYLPKRKKQFLVNTWHGGGAYKSLDPQILNESKIRVSLNIYKRKCTDLVLSSSRVFTETALPTIVYGYHGEILSCGMPRNDIFFSSEKEKRKSKVCKALRIDEKAFIVLYTPTFRGELKRYGKSGSATGVDVTLKLDIDKVLRTIKQRFGREAILLFRKHYTMRQESIPTGVVDVSLYPDIQELLCAADMLISDYSSTIWDYSLLKRPCFLFVPDMRDYLDERGVYTPIQTWPGIIAETNQELCDKILLFDKEGYIKRIEKYHKDMGSYENGTACRKTAERILKEMGKSE